MNNRVSEIAIIPSLYCNLHCEHCFRSAGPHRRERMTDEVLNRLWYVMQEITEDSEPDLTISGGEPLIWSRKFIMRVINHLPIYAFSGVYVATNGTWAKSPAKRHWFLKTLVPTLNTLLSSYPDIGLNVDLSRDQFHYSANGVEEGWQRLKYELTNGFPDDDCYDGYYYPDPEEVKLTERPTYIQKVLPIGRGVDNASYSGGDKTYCHFDGNSPRAENTLTIWPNGRVSACGDGGAWCGNIMFQDWKDILRQRRAFLFHLRREVGAYNGKRNSWNRVPAGVPIGTCGDCEEIGKAYFKTTFRRENGSTR